MNPGDSRNIHACCCFDLGLFCRRQRVIGLAGMRSAPSAGKQFGLSILCFAAAAGPDAANEDR
jgi:hypothetical protein